MEPSQWRRVGRGLKWQYIVNCHFLQRAAKLALQALYTAYPSVRLSVRHTPLLCQNGCGLHRRVAQCLLVFLMVDGEDSAHVKFECKETTSKTAELSTFRLISHNSGTVIGSEESSMEPNTNSIIGFPTSHQPRSCVTPNLPKMGFRCPNLSVFAEISTQKVLNKSLL